MQSQTRTAQQKPAETIDLFECHLKSVICGPNQMIIRRILHGVLHAFVKSDGIGNNSYFYGVTYFVKSSKFITDGEHRKSIMSVSGMYSISP